MYFLVDSIIPSLLVAGLHSILVFPCTADNGAGNLSVGEGSPLQPQSALLMAACWIGFPASIQKPTGFEASGSESLAKSDSPL